MSLLDRLLDLTRKDTPLSRRLRAAAVGFSQFSVPPGRLHRMLSSERALRRQLTDELFRALYWQPMFASLCEEVDGPFRMEICPDSKLPAVVNCRIRIGRGVRFSARTTFSGARNAPSVPEISIGDETYVGHRAVLRAGLGLRIGKRCFFASNVFVSSDPGHPLDPVRRRKESAPVEDLGTIEIGDDVWVAEGAAIIGSVRIGEGSVVAAKAVVTRDVPPFSLVAGAPARVVRTLRPAAPTREAAAG